MKTVSYWLLILQIIAFVVLTFAVFWMYGHIIVQGGAFDARFAPTQIGRLIAFLAPYLALPVSIVLTFVFYKKGKFLTAILLPLSVITLIFAIGQAHLKKTPDPIQENFGGLSEPYAGFLILPKESVPDAFKETEHHYTKREYTISFTKIVDGQKIDLDIVEGDSIMFGTDGSELVKEFYYQGVTGQVYSHRHKKTKVTSYNLIWLNPPKQRIAIYLTQTPKNQHSPEDLIQILKSMEEVP